MCSELWRRHAWVATGTPINAKPQELHGLLAFLGTAPFREEATFNSLVLNAYKQREPHALPRMRTLLRALCLRRSKRDAAIMAQLDLPPLQWETRRLTFSPEERLRYKDAVAVLQRSHRAFARVSSGRGRSSLKSRMLGQLNGDLTRVRQLCCHPSVVNAARPRVGAGGRSGMFTLSGLDGARLPHATVLRRLIARAASERDAAEAAHLRARVMRHVTARSVGVAVGSRESMALHVALPSVLGEIEAREAVTRRELKEEVDDEAAKLLKSSLGRWPKLREEVEGLLEDDEEEAWAEEGQGGGVGQGGGGGSAQIQALVTTAIKGGKRRRMTAEHEERGREEACGGGDGGGKRRQGKARATASRQQEANGEGAAEVVNVIVGDAAKAVAKAAAAMREKQSTHSYLCSLVTKEASAARDRAAAAALTEEMSAAGEPSHGEAEAEDDGGGAMQCPICLDALQPGLTAWAVSGVCGHQGCYECLSAALEERSECPICKKHLTIEGLLPVEIGGAAAAAAEEEAATAREVEDATTKQSRDGASEAAVAALAVAEYGTKVAALVTELGALHAQGDRAVVFSAWTRLLTLAGDALTAHGIPVASLVGSPAAKRAALAAFGNSGGDGSAAVLLVPLFGGASGAGGGGAAGLTLTQARVAVLLEPALQPGIERQAAGRISRIGQTKPTTCVRLIIDETVESKVLQWQEMRMGDGASAAPTLGLNDFAALVE